MSAYSEVIALISTEQTGTDAAGDPLIQETYTEVFAKLKSIRQSEFYQAAAVGLKPEIMFELRDYLDYDDQQILEHEGIRYRVLRTFRAGIRLELTCTREVSKHGRTS